MSDGAEKGNGGVDPRVYLAAERTLLAWLRTGLAMMGFGFVVARFGLFLRELASVSLPNQHSQFSLWAGTSLVLLGVATNIGAVVRHHQTLRRLERRESLQFTRWSFSTIIAIVLALCGLLMAAYLLFSLATPR